MVDKFIARANVDHFLALLTANDLDAEKRAVLVSLLTGEIEKFTEDPEALLEFVLSNGRELLRRIKQIRDSFAEGSAASEEADTLFATIERIVDSSHERIKPKYRR